MKSLVPSVRQGGCGRVIVMPNLNPPIANSKQALDYWNELSSIAPEVTFLMTLYLTEELTVEDLRVAQETAHVIGVKSYPRGVTTGSDAGVEDYGKFYHIFEAMQDLGLSLHLHGEVPGHSVLVAEQLFLPELLKIHATFPKLKIVLEHVTSEAAVHAVINCGPTVAATITVHHLDLTIDAVVGNSFNFCKPVAKLESDRAALRKVIADGNKKFFLGSDSAPHGKSKKLQCCAAAGVFTQPWLLAYLADALDRIGCLPRLFDFACKNGSEFFGISQASEIFVKLVREPFTVPAEYSCDGEEDVVPYRAGDTLRFRIYLL